MDKIRILHLEDSSSDAILIRRELEKGGLSFEILQVDNRLQYLEALRSFHPDIILSDHSLPGFDSVNALEMSQAINADVPFVLVTATVTEGFAVSMLKSGAEDYILKDRLQRLPKAVLNILEKRRAEKEVRLRHDEIVSNEKRFRSLIENSNDLIGLFDADFGVIYRSTNFPRVTGWPINDLRSFGNLSIVHPEDVISCQIVMRDVLANPGKTYNISYRLRHALGHYLWLEGAITNWLDDQSIKGIVLNMRDVSEIRRSELGRRQSHERLLFHIENSPLGFIEWDSQLRIESYSKRAEEIFGWTEKELRLEKKNGYSFVDEVDMTSATISVNDLLSGQISRNNLQLRCRTKDRGVIWCEWFNSAIRDSTGEVVTIMSLVLDITERHKSEEEKTNLVSQLIENNNDLMQFSFIASHNLRGPVSSLLGLTNLFDSLKEKEELAAVIQHIKKATQHLDSVIKDISEIISFRNSEGHVKVAVNIRTLLSELMLFFEADILQHNIDVDLTGIKINIIYSIKSYIHSILYNLISNAIKFRAKNRPAEIVIKNAIIDGVLTMTVADNGVGIDLMKYDQKVFGLYQRFHLSAEGKGLGLYMTKTQVHALKGTIDVESVPDQGTTFTLRFK